MNKNRQVLIFLNVCILILSLVTASYAYLKVALNNTNNMKVSIQTDTLNLSFADGNPGFNGEINFGESITKTFVVENTGTHEVIFELLFQHLFTWFTTDFVSYTFEYSTSENGSYLPIEINDYLFTEDFNAHNYNQDDNYSGCIASITKDYLSIPANTTYYYKLVLSFNMLDDVDQTEDVGSSLSMGFGINEIRLTTNMMKEIRVEDVYQKAYYYNYEDLIEGNQDIFEKHIDTVTILNTGTTVPEDAIESWDMSALGDGSVMAYIMLNRIDGEGEADPHLYDLYITASGSIIANTNSSNMFGYLAFSSINNLEYINTSYSTNMTGMFKAVSLGFNSNLENLDLSILDTSSVTSMSAMFEFQRNLINLNINNLNTSNVTDMSFMFDRCESLSSLDISNFDTSKVINMMGLFWCMSNLEQINLQNFDTSNVTNMIFMFQGCRSLTSLNLSNFNTLNVTNMGGMFEGCSSLNSLDLSSFDTSNVTDMSFMFQLCNSLINLDLSNFNTSNVTNMSYMFSNCHSLISLDLSNFNTSNVTNMSFMFQFCNSLINLDLSNFDTSNVTNMRAMFSCCRSLTSLDLSSFNVSNVETSSAMFQECNNLVTIYVSNNWGIPKDTNSNFVFSRCSKLVGGAGTTYSSSHSDITYAHIDEGPSNPGYFTLKV